MRLARLRRAPVAIVLSTFLVLGLWTVDPLSAGAATSDAGYSLSATDGSSLNGATVAPSLTATLNVPVGTSVSKVKFLLDGAFLGQDTTAPYSWSFSGIAVGAHEIKARATTPAGDKTAIAEIVVSNTPPTTTTTTTSPPTTTTTTAEPTTTTTTTEPPTTTTTTLPPNPEPEHIVPVTTADELVVALANANPGDVITIADGTYLGNFVTNRPGTEAAPITLRGSRNAKLMSDDGNDGGSYGLYLNGANWWKLQGFTIETAKKGLVLDYSSHVIIEGLRVANIGQEAIHLRRHSSDNIVRNNEIDGAGITAPRFGEGVYIGSAVSNWERYTDGQPDRSDRNQVLDNSIVGTRAENIDIKEGTTGGIIRGNFMDGNATAGENSADSWIDVKGNDYLIENNHGVHTYAEVFNDRGEPVFLDGFQIHAAAPGWGANNVFTKNIMEVNASGVGMWIHNTAVPQGNIFKCDNVVTGAAAGLYATNSYTFFSCVP